MSDKPPFDPTKPFEADKPAFDPAKPFEAAKPAEEGWGKTLVRGGLESLPGIGGVVAGAVGGIGSIEAGGLGAIPAAALGYAGGKQLERLGKHYLLGDKDAITTDPAKQLTQTAGDIVEGGTFEMGGQVTGKALTSVGQTISNRLRRTALDAATRHLRPTPTTARIIGRRGLDEISEEALRSGAIRPGGKVADTAANLGETMGDVGALKGALVEQSPATIDPTELAANVYGKVVTPLERTAAGSRLAQPIKDRVTKLLEHLGEGEVPVSRIEAEKMAEQADIPYLSSSTKAQHDVNKSYARTLKESVENAMGNDETFLSAKKVYGNLADAKTMADRTAGLTDGGTGLMGHLGDVGATMEGIEGLATGNPIKMAAPVARSLTKGRVASTVATGAWAAAPKVASATQNFASPVARAISDRVGRSARPQLPAPREERAPKSPNVPRSPESLRRDLVDQQTDPAAQEELKKSQE